MPGGMSAVLGPVSQEESAPVTDQTFSLIGSNIKLSKLDTPDLRPEFIDDREPVS